MIEINEKVAFHIRRDEANFDRACDEAYRHARMLLGLDDDGNLTNVPDADRSASIVLEFNRFVHGASMVGHEFMYWFTTWVEQ